MIDLKVIKQGNLLYDMEPSIFSSLFVKNPLLAIMKNFKLTKNKTSAYLSTLDTKF